MKVNCWKYAREVYLVGRSLKFRKFTETERKAVIDFIIAMAGTRPAYIPYINLKADNPSACEFVKEGEVNKLVWDRLSKQNDYSLGKMVQKIGRSLKIQFCTEEEKALCDVLFAATDNRRGQGYNNYVADLEVEDEETVIPEETESSSEETETPAEGSESSDEGAESSSEGTETPA